MGLLTQQEKAYCRALAALGEKRYAAADREFDLCQALFADSLGFQIVAMATKILARLNEADTELSKIKTEIEEAVNHGQKAIICRQDRKEETR
jgi:hypothetical protein